MFVFVILLLMKKKKKNTHQFLTEKLVLGIALVRVQFSIFLCYITIGVKEGAHRDRNARCVYVCVCLCLCMCVCVVGGIIVEQSMCSTRMVRRQFLGK